MLAAASANIAFNCDLVNSSGCLTPGLRVDTILSTGRAQATNSAGFRFGTALSWVLRLAACDRASGPNELAWRRPRYGYTQDGARSARRSVRRSGVF